MYAVEAGRDCCVHLDIALMQGRLLLSGLRNTGPHDEDSKVVATFRGGQARLHDMKFTGATLLTLDVYNKTEASHIDWPAGCQILLLSWIACRKGGLGSHGVFELVDGQERLFFWLDDAGGHMLCIC